MSKDRKAICDIISEMLDSPDENEIYPTGVAYDKLEALVSNARSEAIGWTHADCCCDLDRGEDPREKIVPGMLARCKVDLEF